MTTQYITTRCPIDDDSPLCPRAKEHTTEVCGECVEDIEAADRNQPQHHEDHLDDLEV